SLANILSAMAEAPDFGSAMSYFLTQVLHIAEAERAFVMRLDASQKTLAAVASMGYDTGAPLATVTVSDLANPFALCAMSLVALRGDGATAPFATTRAWMALPIPQPGAQESAPPLPFLAAQKLVEGRNGARIDFATEGPAPGAPGGLVVVEGTLSERATTELV